MPAFFAICAPVAVVPIGRRFVVALAVLPWALVAALSLRPAAADLKAQPPFWFVPGHGQVTPAELGLSAGGPDLRWYQGKGLYLDLRILPERDGQAGPSCGAGGEAAHAGHRRNRHRLLRPRHARRHLRHPGTRRPAHRPHATGPPWIADRPREAAPDPWIAAALSAPGSSIEPFDRLHRAPRQDHHAADPSDVRPRARRPDRVGRAALACPAIHQLEYGQTAR